MILFVFVLIVVFIICLRNIVVKMLLVFYLVRNVCVGGNELIY